MQLNPLEQFTIVRQLDWAADPNTYYVQAVIYNVQNNAVIAKVNLSSLGNQKFSQAWQVLGNPGMMGFYISIVTTVYTDSGYTQVSPTYSTVENTYLVQQRYVPALGPNGGGIEVDYKMIRKLIQEELGFLKKKSPANITEKDIESVMYRVVGLLFDQVGNPLRSLQDGYSRNEKFINDFSQKKERGSQELLSSFQALLDGYMNKFLKVANKQNETIEDSSQALSKELISVIKSMTKASFTSEGAFYRDMSAELKKYFRSLVDDENNKNKKELANAVLSLSRALKGGLVSDADGEMPAKPQSLIPPKMREFMGLPKV